MHRGREPAAFAPQQAPTHARPRPGVLVEAGDLRARERPGQAPERRADGLVAFDDPPSGITEPSRARTAPRPPSRPGRRGTCGTGRSRPRHRDLAETASGVGWSVELPDAPVEELVHVDLEPVGATGPEHGDLVGPRHRQAVDPVARSPGLPCRNAPIPAATKPCCPDQTGRDRTAKSARRTIGTATAYRAGTSR